jgi:GntR family transcriptional regulator
MFIKRGAVAGTIADGDELPSRRVLSALLGVNPNTIQKAYRILEEEGLIQSRSGAKSCMVLDSKRIDQLRRELLEGEVKCMVHQMRQMGISKEDAVTLLNHWWNEV